MAEQQHPDSSPTGPGGFLPPQRQPHQLPSPAPSGASSSGLLPRPRARPLRSGSAKEEKIRTYVENQLMSISRRLVKKFEAPKPGDDVVGYRAIGELCADVEALMDIIWLSGTPSLQIPYLLNIANEFTEWITRLPPAQPRSIFSVLRKLDHCFASLLAGRDVETGEGLPGFDGARGVMTRTHMVRCRSIVEQTRVVVVDVMSSSGDQQQQGGVVDDDDDDDDEDETEQDSDTDLVSEAETVDGAARERGFVDPNWDDEDDELFMDVARVYERTLVQLGEVFQNSALP